ncbi:WAT1-related protein At4g08290-like [Prosopis cineraria]|uniref:WAT1-related protein At4g08290-like n=1 Tax=Prosopis cineraria TaxID=364024 RepID=UPI00240EFC51|nr:WAT1-related protein At4g08290-like [Prosopis cineraria]
MKYCEKAGAWLRGAKPYLLMVGLQFGSAGMYIMAKDALNKGMSHYVFIVYRNAIAALSLGPFALVLERKVRPKMTFRIFSEIMALAFVEVILDQCFTLLGMKLTSASFVVAVMNTVPAITFVLAVLLGMERMKMKEIRCQAKVMGTVITVGGALLMALYKGPIVDVASGSSGHPENVSDPAGSQWLLGSFVVLVACIAFSGFYILQAVTLRKYPAEMSLATWICLVGSFQSAGVAAYMERHRPQAWSVAWDSTFFAPAYSGIVTSGIQYYVQGVVMRRMGPVFVTAFNPLRMIIVTSLACLLLSEQLHLGSIIGGVVVSVGLYLVAWGKYREFKDVMPPSPAKDSTPHWPEQQLPVTMTPTAVDHPNPHESIVICDQNTCPDSTISNNTQQPQSS